MGAEVGLSGSAILRRLKRLRDLGVIQREIAVLARDKVGSFIRLIASLEIEREQLEPFRALVESLDGRPEIQQAFYVSGEVDVILVVVVENIDQYDRLSAELLARHPFIKRITTNVVFRDLKSGLALPL